MELGQEMKHVTTTTLSQPTVVRRPVQLNVDMFAVGEILYAAQSVATAS
jgi:hypothetical protein